MRRLWVGMLLASLPLSVLAQQGTILRETLPPVEAPPERKPSNDGWFNPVPPGTPQVRRPSSDGWFNPAPPPPASTVDAPSNDPATAASPDDSVNAPPAPPDESGTVVPVPRDDSVTAVPLPPPDQEARPDRSTDASPEMVPNPLDNPNAVPAPGASQQARPRGQPQGGGWVKMSSATLQVLDKVNAIGQTLVVKVGDTGHFGSLDIGVRGCFVRPPDRPADATAFLVINDERPDSPSFTGWMVQSAPYMSMLAHPIYDVRVTGCT